MSGTVKGALESSKQLLEMWKVIVEDLGSTARTEQGIAIRWAESKFSFFNSLSFDDENVTKEELEKRLSFAYDFMQKGKYDGAFWLFEELLKPKTKSDLESILKQAHFQRIMTCFGMAGNIPSLVEPIHPELRFERVRTQEHLRAYAILNEHGYGLPESTILTSFQNLNLWFERVYGYIGYQDNIPVSCASVYPIDGCLFVVLVATEPNYQKRGYAESVMRKALYEGTKATGFTRAILQATAAGKAVYERIGLEVTSIVQILQPIK